MNDSSEIGLAEVGPHDIGEEQLSVCALPKQEVTQPLLSTRSDEQIHVASTAGGVDGLMYGSFEGLAGGAYPFGDTAGRLQQRFAGRIIDRDPDVESGSIVRSFFDMCDHTFQRIREPVPTPDDAQAHTFIRQAGALGVQVDLEKAHQVVHFALRTAPIVRRECVEG